jgi:methionyl aminopeptidase
MSIIIKTTEQIEGIRKSCQLAAESLRFIENYVKEGVTTLYLNDLLDQYIRDHGAIPAPLDYNGFPKSICTSLNEVICHGIPDSTVLKYGDILNIDVTTILDGYYGDTCTMFQIGNIPKRTKKLIKVTKKCLEIGIAEVKPDAEFGNISKAISKHARENNFSVVYQFCGHGTGLEFHEEPQVSHFFDGRNFDNRKMKPGMIFTIEPMICTNSATAKILEDKWTAVTVDGGLSAQYEHTVLVTDHGCEILTL